MTTEPAKPTVNYSYQLNLAPAPGFGPPNDHTKQDDVYDYIIDQNSIQTSQNEVYGMTISMATKFEAEDKTGINHGVNSASESPDEHGIENQDFIEMSQNQVYGMPLSTATEFQEA